MYMIMNQDQNQSHAPNTVNAYGNIEHGTIVTESVPPPLQPLQNYTTYELVGQDTGHVIFPNETTNIIVSAMQVPGQDDLVFFHDQTVGDLASYSIEIQDPNPVTNIPAIEYYPEQHQTQRVMSYETLQQSPQQTHMMSPMQDQNIVLQQQMCQTQSLPQQQQQPQQQEQHVVETQLPPSGQILKQQLQGSPPQSQQLPPIRSQVQITPVMQQQPRPRMMQQQPQQQTHLQQPVYVQQQQGPSPHHQQQQQAQQQQQFVVQNQQLQQQQQFVQQNHPQGAKLVQNQQHFVQKQMPMQQQNVQQHFVQQKQMVQNQHFVLQQQQPKQMLI
ncbi:putative mediator of RNA polymerase II transcription subunit 26 [Diaphorina citri]|uniref:Mediator of RNA polymerase II transcription subunit 26 n=1 Tax=Diaphorina citri TaxID=121845 RepID=A0A3Q0JEJ8_DIACI|nr:putative mediator of RNA polymerase II transcription subunit 26 [Diaphorina citri]